MALQINKDGQLLRIRPVTSKVEQLLTNLLKYMRRRMLMTKYERDMAGGKYMELEAIECYKLTRFNSELQLITNAGFLDRIVKALAENKIEYEVIDLYKPKNPGIYVPNWAGVKSFDFRPGQKEVLEALSQVDRGRVWWATGTGKSFLIPLVCKLYPKLNIVVTTKHKAVLNDIYKNLCSYLPSVGIYHSSKKVTGKRVMCYSAGCLGHADADTTHMVIGDEIHELATDQVIAQFARFKYAKMFGFSANMNDRFDGADFELEGLFGPVVTSLTYQDGVKQGVIVPIDVNWRNVYMDRNPCENSEGVVKLRKGIWRNRHRNGLIAKDALAFKDEQVLITVKTFDHACHLKQLLPDYTLVYAADDKEADMDTYIKWKLISPEEPKMSLNRLERLKTMFEKGELRKVIATSVWNRGVNFKELQVLIRADASSSAIDDTQIPGRLSRKTDKFDKSSGILIDYLDQFDDGLKRKAAIRKKNYADKGWNNIMPDSSVPGL